MTRGPSPATLAALQVPTQQFIRERLLQGAEPTREAVEAALLRLADDWSVLTLTHCTSVLWCDAGIPTWRRRRAWRT